MAWLGADVEQRALGDRDRDAGRPPAPGELLIRIPGELAPQMVRALTDLANLVEQRHGATRMVGLGRLMAEVVRDASLAQ